MQINEWLENRIARRDKKRKLKMKMHGKSVFEIKKLRSKKHDKNKRTSKRD